MEGVVVAIHGQQAEIDVRGKRLRAKLKELRVIGVAGVRTAPPPPRSASTSISSRAKGCSAS